MGAKCPSASKRFVSLMIKIRFYVEEHELCLLDNSCVLLGDVCVWLSQFALPGWRHKERTRDRNVFM